MLKSDFKKDLPKVPRIVLFLICNFHTDFLYSFHTLQNPLGFFQKWINEKEHNNMKLRLGGVI